MNVFNNRDVAQLGSAPVLGSRMSQV